MDRRLIHLCDRSDHMLLLCACLHHTVKAEQPLQPTPTVSLRC